MKKPCIGITANILMVESGVLAGTERIYVNRDYVTSILRAQGIPLMLPLVADIEALYRQIDSVDALLLSGGQDVNPHYYNEDPSFFLETVSLERDIYEMEAVRYAYKQKKPIFGICRGLQLLNVAFGGTLYQDISKHYPTAFSQHSQKARKDEPSHLVQLEEGSWFKKVLKKEQLFTNSFHHQAIKDLSPQFKMAACANDGVIEAIESKDDSFVIGVQWHPEMMTEKKSEMQQLFDAFVQEVALRASEAYAHIS
jgi:putative glutamine amidotransferase